MKLFTFEIDDERRYEVDPFIVDHERQVGVLVRFVFNSWGKWTIIHGANVAGVTNVLADTAFWFPGTVTDGQFPQVLRDDALRAVNAAWALAFPKVDDS